MRLCGADLVFFNFYLFLIVHIIFYFLKYLKINFQKSSIHKIHLHKIKSLTQPHTQNQISVGIILEWESNQLQV